MRTLGIDLAAADANTAACTIDWSASPASVAVPETGLSDDRLIELVEGADKAAIDCPLGWPDSFVDALMRHRDGQPWPGTDRLRLRFRATDLFVAGRAKWPMSVSSDRIGVAAMRCAALMARLGVTDRSGTGRIVEAYPAAALIAWGFDARGYKMAAGTQRRRALTGALLERSATWLGVGAEVLAACTASDHALDAMVCALVARACSRGLTELPPDDLSHAARREGWIHLPKAGSFGALAR